MSFEAISLFSTIVNKLSARPNVEVLEFTGRQKAQLEKGVVLSYWEQRVFLLGQLEGNLEIDQRHCGDMLRQASQCLMMELSTSVQVSGEQKVAEPTPDPVALMQSTRRRSSLNCSMTMTFWVQVQEQILAQEWYQPLYKQANQLGQSKVLCDLFKSLFKLLAIRLIGQQRYTAVVDLYNLARSEEQVPMPNWDEHTRELLTNFSHELDKIKELPELKNNAEVGALIDELEESLSIDIDIACVMDTLVRGHFEPGESGQVIRDEEGSTLEARPTGITWSSFFQPAGGYPFIPVECLPPPPAPPPPPPPLPDEDVVDRSIHTVEANTGTMSPGQAP